MATRLPKIKDDFVSCRGNNCFTLMEQLFHRHETKLCQGEAKTDLKGNIGGCQRVNCVSLRSECKAEIKNEPS